MSGFSPEWLALREPADRDARSHALLERVGAHFAGRREMLVLDIGCGTGSTLRALAPRLPEHQFWRLVDHDPALLAAARERLAAWAEEAEDAEGGDLVLTVAERTVRVRLEQADLAPGVARLLAPAPALVTASALFDLVSPAWIDGFARECAAAGAAVYAALTYNGLSAWDPPHPADAAVLDAFHVHQGRDKGFGAAAGPDAPAALEQALEAQGYACEAADSDWVLGPDDGALMAELATGIAQAAAETGAVPPAEAQAWAAARAGARRAIIGHTDLFAVPPRS
ncbi:SAM-dependent methyltransferase [Alsobacter soli]|uniref:SAM-dependent methyltransferase n=1 Tax=Alsobacter soli TaxID=2109933 RepID=A0A2T1HLY2_9HYPH|nr:class I SAM-dependent methyltransferase [Alsobacter soli]PSC02664.1 SAM-dependent methyltransferase [Alsobacter soli]